MTTVRNTNGIQARIARIEEKLDGVQHDISTLTAALLHPKTGFSPRSETELISTASGAAALTLKEDIDRVALALKEHIEQQVRDDETRRTEQNTKTFRIIFGFALVTAAWLLNFLTMRDVVPGLH